MPVRQFSLYDIIADVIPGITAIVVLFPILPRPILSLAPLSDSSTPLGVGILFLILGYPAGRFIHGLAAQPSVEGLRVRWRNFSSYFIQIKSPTSLEDVYINPSEYKGVNAGSVYSAFSELNKYESPSSIEEYKQLMYSLVYPHKTLYQKYNLLTTAYRSFWLISVIGFILYLGNTLAVLISRCHPLVEGIAGYKFKILAFAIFLLGFALFVLTDNESLAPFLLFQVSALLFSFGLLNNGTIWINFTKAHVILSIAIIFGLLLSSIVFLARYYKFKNREIISLIKSVNIKESGGFPNN